MRCMYQSGVRLAVRHRTYMESPKDLRLHWLYVCVTVLAITVGQWTISMHTTRMTDH